MDAKVISLPFVHSKNQLVDILTRAISTKMFEDVIFKLGVEDPIAQLERECWKVSNIISYCIGKLLKIVVSIF